MQLILYENFAKRKNSTKQPTGGTMYDVRLKAGCSTENPVFLIDGVNLNVNYARWNGGCYFVDEIVIGNNNIYELHCSIDVLATYKAAIGASTQFIARAASAYDTLLSDELVSVQRDITRSQSVAHNITLFDPTPGVYLLQTFSRKGINVYAYTDLADIQGILNNDAYGVGQSNLTALVQTIGMNILDVSAYVTNVMWFPFNIATLNGQTENVAVAFWELNNFQAKRVTTRGLNYQGSITLPANDYAANDFRRYDPHFSRYSLYLPGVGHVDLPSINVSDSLTFSLTVDIFTGNCTYLIYNMMAGGATAQIAEYSGQLGVQIPYCTMNVDAIGLLQNAVSPNINIMGGAPGVAMSAANTAWSVVRDLYEPMTSVHTAAGNMSELMLRSNLICSVTNYGSKEFPLAEAGRPLCEHRQINTLSGFILCNGASLETAAHGNEKDVINNYLNSGFYYE